MKKQNKFLAGIVLLLMVSFYSCTNNEEMFDGDNEVELKAADDNRIYYYKWVKIYIKFNDLKNLRINVLNQNNDFSVIDLDEFAITNEYNEVWGYYTAYGYTLDGSTIIPINQTFPNSTDRIVADLEEEELEYEIIYYHDN